MGSYYGGSCAVSGDIDDYETSWMEMKVTGPGTVTFWWKVSSEYGDYLEFYIDGVRKASIDGIRAWAQSSAYQIAGAGTHTLRWQYVKDGSGTENDDCGWADYVQWSGFTPEQPPGTWETLRYNYDHDGRRSEKKYDGQTILTYIYDGDHCIAEYDGNGVLQRKYIHGPGVDQPICMIEGAATSYYHFDALGSVVALSNAAGNTIQVYEYSVWGQVGASDPNHTNPYMFTARRFDKETGLYYYRARYYNPEIGRFLQTDPVGYDAGMNLYRYCSNNPWNRLDPFGLYDSNDTNDVNDSNDSPDSPPASPAPAPPAPEPVPAPQPSPEPSEPSAPYGNDPNCDSDSSSGNSLLYASGSTRSASTSRKKPQTGCQEWACLRRQKNPDNDDTIYLISVCMRCCGEQFSRRIFRRWPHMWPATWAQLHRCKSACAASGGVNGPRPPFPAKEV